MSTGPGMHEQIDSAIAQVIVARPNFAARTAALEFLDRHVFDRLQTLAQHVPADLQPLLERATRLRGALELGNARAVQRLRKRIAAGRCTPAGLLRAFERHAEPGLHDAYDVLDVLISELLDTEELPQERVQRTPEMVAYQPTPARAILQLIARAGLAPGDVFYDLGSGLGRVVMLVALLSEASAIGIELEPAFCEYARRAAARLNAPRTRFVCADARQAEFDDGSMFFMYTPFRGALLQCVLERIEAVARRRPIRVCTYGPCTEVVAQVAWLRGANPGGRSPHELALFHSRAPA